MAPTHRGAAETPSHIPDLSRAAIARWLQAARATAGKTQREAADHLGVEKQTVSNWETARHPIGAEELLALALFYKADILELTAIKVTKAGASGRVTPAQNRRSG